MDIGISKKNHITNSHTELVSVARTHASRTYEYFVREAQTAIARCTFPFLSLNALHQFVCDYMHTGISLCELSHVLICFE